jgi:putative phosphoribosyl transferase
MIFSDRDDAGKRLAEELKKYIDEDPVVLAVPRGGVVIAYETIKRFGYKWDLIIPRKIGAPHNKEIAIGAVSSDGTYFVNNYYVSGLGITKEYIEQEVFEQVNEIKRRLKDYRGSETLPDLKDKTVIIIDDGIATGFTILAAIKSIKKQEARKIVLAVPVSPRETFEEFKEIVDEFVCLYIPHDFYSVGAYYNNFEQVEDEEVFKIIDELRREQ